MLPYAWSRTFNLAINSRNVAFPLAKEPTYFRITLVWLHSLVVAKGRLALASLPLDIYVLSWDNMSGPVPGMKHVLYTIR